MDTKVIELGYASDLERVISKDLQETIVMLSAAQAKREQAFLSTVKDLQKRLAYKNVYAFLDSSTPDTVFREPLLSWFKQGVESLFPTAKSACFMPNRYPIPNILPDGRKNPHPVVVDATSWESVFFKHSTFDILTFARKHISELPYINDCKVEKKVELITIPNNRNILIIPIGEPDSELLACIYLELRVPLVPKVLEALNDHVYGSRQREELQTSLPTVLLYRTYRAFLDLGNPQA